MSTVLSISNKLFSLKGKMFIDDENGDRLYDANGEFAFFCPTWTIKNSASEVASIKRKLWSWAPVWNVKSTIGDFLVKRKLFSWTRTYSVIGGPYSGAVVKGNIWDLKFAITHNDKSIASAKGKILSLRDRHNILVHDTDETSEIFTTIIMVTLQLDRKNKRGSAVSSD
jgi:uncharacterized protein YxjI